MGLALVLALLLPAARAAEPADLKLVTFEHAGRPRRAWLYLPPGDAKNRPVVLVLGGRQGVEGFRNMTRRGFEELAARDGTLVAYPEPVANIWNDGRGVKTFPSHVEDVDDVGFLTALIDRLASQHGGSRRRVYAVGWSNGAMMAQRLVCERPDQFRAAASVAGTLAQNLAGRCKRPKGPLSVMVVYGDADTFYDWKEGTVRIGPFELGRIVPPEKLQSLWRGLLQCGKAAKTVLADRDPEDGSSVSLGASKCRDGAALRLYRVRKGGHTWPGGEPWEMATLTGPVNGDLDATAEAWKLFFPR